MSRHRSSTGTARALVLGLVALAGVAAGACSFGGGDSDASATAPADGSGTSVAAADGTAASEVVFSSAPEFELEAGRIDLPSSLALVAVRDGELWRIHRAPNGAVEERLLFDPFAYSSTRLLTYTSVEVTGPALPAGELAITACSTGECPAVGAASEDALATILESIDGGVSWVASEELDGVARVVSGGGNSEERILRRLARTDDSRTGRFEWWRSGRVIDPPAAWGGEGEPAVLPDGRILWWASDGRMVDSTGEAVLNLGDGLSGGSVARGLAVLPNDDGSQLAVAWQENAPGSLDGPLRLSTYQASGDGFAVSNVFAALSVGVPVAWISDTTLLVTAELERAALGESGNGTIPPRLPVILDIVAGTATAIDVPEGTLGAGWVVAAQVGPFAEVNAGEGDCLNLRAEGSPDGGVLRCIPHATLLERLSPLDGEWVNVRTSDGVEGWVSGEFVRQTSTGATAAPSASATASP